MDVLVVDLTYPELSGWTSGLLGITEKPEHTEIVVAVASPGMAVRGPAARVP